MVLAKSSSESLKRFISTFIHYFSPILVFLSYLWLRKYWIYWTTQTRMILLITMAMWTLNFINCLVLMIGINSIYKMFLAQKNDKRLCDSWIEKIKPRRFTSSRHILKSLSVLCRADFDFFYNSRVRVLLCIFNRYKLSRFSTSSFFYCLWHILKFEVSIMRWPTVSATVHLGVVCHSLFISSSFYLVCASGQQKKHPSTLL